ncbi:MAG: sugar-transfer associated ATP-grasp domain-containing protein [Tateyamaria sp.]
MEQMATKALLTPPPTPVPAAPQMIVEVARAHGVSPFRQMREMWAVRRGPGQLKSHEYHASGVYDPELQMEEKKTFVGEMGSFKLNLKLSPADLTPLRAFIRDKAMYAALLDRLGARTTHTQAVVHPNRAFGNIPVLRDPQAIIDFLTNDAAYPLFGKPCEGSKSVGSALITGLEGNMLRLGNGREVDLDGFAHELVADYPEGFILQSAVQQHPDMTAITGPAVGTLRIVTLRDENGAKVLYSLWKLPSPSAMSDNFWQAGSMVAQVGDDGVVTRCKRGTGLAAEWIDTHPVSGKAIVGAQIPHWDAVHKLALDNHMLFPEFGVFGWDIAVDADGPLVVECNANPFHTLYQIATGEGALNPRHMARFEATMAYSQELRKRRFELEKAQKKAV